MNGRTTQRGNNDTNLESQVRRDMEQAENSCWDIMSYWHGMLGPLRPRSMGAADYTRGSYLGVTVPTGDTCEVWRHSGLSEQGKMLPLATRVTSLGCCPVP